MFNFSELKDKAHKAKAASVTKFTDTKDRFSSTPAAKTNWDPHWKKPPPPPAPTAHITTQTNISSRSPPPIPQRISSSTSTQSQPPHVPSPPIPNRSRPGQAAPPIPTRRDSGVSSQEVNQTPEIEWSNLSPEDKEVFFSWLDEFFSQHLDISLTTREPASMPSSLFDPPSSDQSPAPPPVPMSTKPKLHAS